MKIFRISLFILLTIPQAVLLLAQSSFPRLSKLEIVSELPEVVYETSGLIFFNNLWWTLNDSGGEPCLYALDLDKRHLQTTVCLANTKNKDWEELSQDETHVYIGDFGNNNGSREQLTIYKVDKNELLNMPQANITSEKIVFEYTQKKKPTKLMGRSAYDCEAMICKGDSLYLFTKNWVTQQSEVYQVSKVPGTYQAKKLATIPADGLVTGAALSPDSRHVWLVGYADYTPFILCVDFISFQILTRYEYPQYTGYQTEAIAFDNERNLFVTSEKTAAHPITMFRAGVK